MVNFNKIYDDKVVKTTINIPKEMVSSVYSRMKRLNIAFFSVYIRALIQKDIEGRDPLTIRDILKENSFLDNKEEYPGKKRYYPKLFSWFYKKSY